MEFCRRSEVFKILSRTDNFLSKIRFTFAVNQNYNKMKKILFITALATTMSVFASCSRPAENSPQQNSIENPENQNPKNQAKMKITIGNQTFTATLSNTISAKEFQKKLPLTLEMQDYGGFEKMAPIDRLPTADKRENSLDLGDLMLYSGNTLVLFYAPHGGYSYTRIGKIDNPEGLKQALGSGKVVVKFESVALTGN